MKFLIATATLTAAMVASMATAQAADENNQLNSNAVSHCQGALPSFEGALRKRPLAVDNVGSSDSFVTCAFELRGGSGALGHAVSVWFGNNTATPKTINCTAVQGFNGESEAVTGSVVVLANTQGELFWEDADFAAGIGGLLSISCQMPGGTGINDTYAAWLENDATEPPAP